MKLYFHYYLTKALNMNHYTLLILITIIGFVIGYINIQPLNAQTTEIEPEILEAVQNQIDKEKKFGYDNFSLIYVTKGGDDKIRLLYTTANSTLDPGSKFISGYTVTKSITGQWYYVGSKTVSYSNNKDLENMKSWADDIVKN